MLGAGPLISAGVSLLSGLFGRSSAKAQAKKEEDAIREANRVASENAARMNLEVRSRADAAALVPVQTARYSEGGVNMAAFLSAAEEGGFNPLTFLRSGALAHFSQSFDETCTTGEHAMDAALAGQYIPQLAPVLAQTKVPGMGEVFGNALTSGASQYLSEASEQRQFANDVFKMQLSGAQRAGSYSGMRFGTVPQVFLPSQTSASGGGKNGAFPMYIEVVDNDPSSARFGEKRFVVNPQVVSGPEAAMVAPVDVPNLSRNAGEEYIKAINGAIDWAKSTWNSLGAVVNPRWVKIDPDGTQHW